MCVKMWLYVCIGEERRRESGDEKSVSDEFLPPVFHPLTYDDLRFERN